MADHRDSKIHDWWYDAEFNEYCALMETTNHVLHLVTNGKKELPPPKKDK